MTRTEIKIKMKLVINNLKSMAEEYEYLYNEMDELTDDEFDKKAEYIEDTYSKYGIELF